MKRLEENRLVYYRRSPDAAFWEEHWEKAIGKAFYNAALKGGLGWFERAFTKYLPKNERILEAGCGLGQFVVALRYLGYQAEGIDWAGGTIRQIKELFPDLPVTQGDATAISAPDGSYGGYVSIGVVEHRKEGPEPFLNEAYRVLREGGIAIFTVPCFNRLRRIKGAVGFFRKKAGGGEFYQYAFSDKEFRRLVEAAGFGVLEQWGYDSYKCLMEEIPLLRKASKIKVGRYQVGSAIQKILARSSLIENHAGHMLLLVCRKG